MRFPFGNKIPWSTVVEEKGKKFADLLIGIPGDMEFEIYGDKHTDNLTFLLGTKKGSRPLLIAVSPVSLSKAILKEMK